VVTLIRTRDGQLRRMKLRPDAKGRLNFELGGDDYQVGIGAGPTLALGDYEVQGAPWATDGKPVSVRVRVWNKGTTTAAATTLRWETPNPGVAIATPTRALPAIAAGTSADTTLAFTVEDPGREIVKLFAVIGENRLPLEIPTFPYAQPSKTFRIADGGTLTIFQEGIKPVALAAGKGNGDGKANPG